MRFGSTLLSDKQFRILNNIESAGFMHEVSKKADVTYSHVYKVIEFFVKKGLIEKKNRRGRIRKLILTEKGEKLLELYLQAYHMLK